MNRIKLIYLQQNRTENRKRSVGTGWPSPPWPSLGRLPRADVVWL